MAGRRLQPSRGDVPKSPRDVRFLGSLPRLTDGTYTSRLIDVLASDDRAAVLYRANGRREGRELDIDQLLVFTLLDGVVTEVLALPSDRFAFDTFWGTT